MTFTTYQFNPPVGVRLASRVSKRGSGLLRKKQPKSGVRSVTDPEGAYREVFYPTGNASTLDQNPRADEFGEGMFFQNVVGLVADF